MTVLVGKFVINYFFVMLVTVGSRTAINIVS